MTIGLYILIAGLVIMILGFSLWLREEYKRDQGAPDLHTDWQANDWIRGSLK